MKSCIDNHLINHDKFYISASWNMSQPRAIFLGDCTMTFESFTYLLVLRSVLETKAGPSVRDRQFLVRTRNFLHISLQINVWISQNSDQDRQLFQLSPEHWLRSYEQ